MPKKNVAGNSGMPLTANLLKLGFSILPRAKRAANRKIVATEKRNNFFFYFFFLNLKKKLKNILCFSVATLFRFVARFARGRIENPSFNRFALNGIQRYFFGGFFPGGFYPVTELLSMLHPWR